MYKYARFFDNGWEKHLSSQVVTGTEFSEICRGAVRVREREFWGGGGGSRRLGRSFWSLELIRGLSNDH
jgi:hypothetical protein